MPQDILTDPFGQLKRREAVRESLTKAQQPSDDNVWKARILGGLAGSGRAVYDLLAGSDEDTVDPTIGLAPVASIGQKGLGTVASEAYKAIRGIPNLYSRLTNAATKLPEVMPTSQAQAALRGLQAPLEEMHWRKVPEMLAGKGPKVTRSEIMEHLDDNPIELEMHQYDTRGTGPQPHYEDYSTPGENYRERIITLPQEQSAETLAIRKARDKAFEALDFAKYEGNNPEKIQLLQDQYDRLMRAADERPDPHLSGHFGEFNDIIGWIRSNETNVPQLGGKGRLAQTIQSDWHQAGSQLGYSPEENRAIADKIKQQIYPLYDEGRRLGYLHEDYFPSLGSAGEEFMEKLSKLEERLAQVKGADVPNAPFRKDWPALLMKSELLDIAEKPDVNWFGVVSPEVQAARWHGSSEEFRPLFNQQVRQLEKTLAPYGGGPSQFFSRRNRPGPDITGAGVNIPPETKELIRKYGFPAFAALTALQQTLPSQEPQ